MTDNRTNTQNNSSENKDTSAPNANHQPTPTKTVTPNNLPTERKNSNSSVKDTKGSKPQVKKVVVVIAGHNYNIFCPVHEEAELRSAVFYINNFVLDTKREAPNLGQESLLLLSCLNLYEKINTQQKADETHRHETEQAVALLSKIMKDAQSIL
ncbi:cell division protein ZapA [Psychrobacter sp. CAL346-MNA-CIBAN-0220]|uniref:cell division protein ZapA n=1 Tax=Psychrobacter sp. CAL346-MNA-CIBAN-0220 TaxID=3140457 RepID=UPI003332D236